MPETVPKNPVQQRLLELADHWVDFREDSTKRLLVWRANANAVRFFECFFEAQKHASDFSLKDIFLVFPVPFENAVQYSRELKEFLAGQYAAGREDLKKQGISPDWQFTPEEFPHSATGFVRSLQSFGSKHHEHMGHLAAVLMPAKVVDSGGFAAWLLRALTAGFPQRLRLVVLDTLESPHLSRLCTAPHELIRVAAPPIDGLATAQETFAREGAVGPAGVFRNLLMGLMTLVEKGPLEQVKVKAADALAFAQREKWADQQVVVKMLVAGALLKEKRFEEAVSQYQHARSTAEQATAQGHPAGQQMVLQTWFGEAGVHLAAGNPEKAAACYDEAALAAQQIPNLILGIEAFRMGAFCFSGMQAVNPAVQRGENALTLGEQLKPDVRAMTTLPIAALDLLRTIDPQRVEAMQFITHRHREEVSAARSNADRTAVDLEQSQDVNAFCAIETQLAQTIAQAEQAAAHKLNALAAGGNEAFQKAFKKSRDLLGPGWPLEPLKTLAGPMGENAP